MLETIGYALNPGTRRRRTRARRAKGRRARRRRNSFFGHPRKHARAARKGHRRRRARLMRRRNPSRRRHYARRGRGRRRRNPDVFSLGALAGNPRRRRRRNAARRSSRRSRRSRNPVQAAMSGMRFPQIVPGLHLPLPGIVGTIVNGAVQGVAAGGIVFAGYFGSGALIDLVVNRNDAAMARSAGDKWKGYWARPLMFAGAAGVFAGLAGAVAPKGKGMLWGLLAAAGPAVRAFGGIVFALLGESAVQETGIKGDIAAAAVGLSDYIQTGELYNAGMGDEDEGMEDYIQTGGSAGGADDGTEDMGELYNAGMGEEEPEVIGI